MTGAAFTLIAILLAAFIIGVVVPGGVFVVPVLVVAAVAYGAYRWAHDRSA